MPRPWSLLRQSVLAVLLVALAAGAWYGQDAVLAALGGDKAALAEGKGKPPRGVPVIVAPTTVADDRLVLEAVGTGRANRSVMLRAEAEGRIAAMPLAAGQRFRAGDELLRIADTEERLLVDLAKTRLAEARRTLARMIQLKGRGAATTASLDEARTASEIAAIELGRAEEALADHVLRAPFDGVAGLPSVELGAWVDNAIAVASFDDRSVILVEFDLPEALLARVHAGLAVSATTPAVPNARFEGHVAAIDSRIVASSRSVKVRVAIPNPDDRLRPGASFAVRLELPGDRYPLVPELALQFGHGALHVWRVRDGKAEKVEVRLVRRREGAVLVDGPLAAGDAVVVEGTQRLHPGRAVTVLKATDGTG
ncbi:MAG: efflux RND transporter periplasmic adaptor subunit [Alphaproteobacteria bacterium]|nr:efflux RND transporter periplasmic adaptor subunit [Alphaproteobacteria bacterium]